MSENINQLDMLDGKARLQDFAADDAKKAEEEERAKKNKGFTQLYSRGFKRLQDLVKKDPSAARLYLFLAEHVDGTGGLVASQDVLAEFLECSRRTIIRLIKKLEDENALVKVRVGSGVYCYALDPDEVWKSWDSKKETAIFNTKTLVSKRDKENKIIDKRIGIMMKERNQLN